MTQFEDIQKQLLDEENNKFGHYTKTVEFFKEYCPEYFQENRDKIIDNLILWNKWIISNNRIVTDNKLKKSLEYPY